MSHIQTAHADLFCWWFQYCNKGFKVLLVVSVLQQRLQGSVGGFSTATKASRFCWWFQDCNKGFKVLLVFQYCNKGFKQPGSLNYHMKATHNLDIPLSQGLEERYLRLKTRSAMRNLAAMEGWTPRLEQEGGNGKSRYSPALPSASCAGWNCLSTLCCWAEKCVLRKKGEKKRKKNEVRF